MAAYNKQLRKTQNIVLWVRSYFFIVLIFCDRFGYKVLVILEIPREILFQFSHNMS